MAIAAIGPALMLAPAFAATAAAYAALLGVYSLGLKHVVIIDVLAISAGFVLRAVAGAQVVAVPISQWLLVCTTLLALFLALSKRRHELTMLADGAAEHRPILGEYSPYLLDQMIAVVTASTLIAYGVYATSLDTAQRLGTTRLGLTIPFVLYGIFRYLYLVHRKRGGGDPSAHLVSDRPLLACVALWALSVVLASLLTSRLTGYLCQSTPLRLRPRFAPTAPPESPSCEPAPRPSSRTTLGSWSSRDTKTFSLVNATRLSS